MPKGKYTGTLVGCALGDTLGMPVEAWKPGHIKKYVGRVEQPMDPVIVKDDAGNIITEDEFGKIKYWTRALKKGDITDDTILTLAIAESIAANKGLNLVDACQRQLEAYKATLNEEGKSIRAFGNSTQQAFKNIENGIPPEKSGYNGPGNGPAMKMHPVGLYMRATGEYEQGIEFARALSAATHLDTRSIASGIVQAHAIYELVEGITEERFIESIVGACKKYEQPIRDDAILPEAGTLLSKLEWVRDNLTASPEKAYQHLKNSSLAWESYHFTLFMFLKYRETPIEGLLETINYGGDCDTTGAIYGALVGARDGYIFPRTWLKHIPELDRLINAASAISDLRRY